MGISQEQLSKLKELIYFQMVQEFSVHYVTKNLLNTMTVEYTPEGLSINIPAEIYDMKLWNEKGVIVYTGAGSYASVLDERGSIRGNHKDYVIKSIEKAVAIWMKLYNFQGRMSKE